MSNTRLYRIWDSMKSRCNNPNHKSYAEYGGRGICICDEWESFIAFMEWAIQNGYQEDLTIDRKNNDLGYCPENCKWSTPLEQARNRRTNTIATIDGVSRTLSEWEEESGVPAHVISQRLKAGWTDSDAIFMPEKRINRNRIGFVAHNARPILRVNDGMVFRSTREAADASEVDNSSVVKVCKGKRESTRGWVFRYLQVVEAGKGELNEE